MTVSPDGKTLAVGDGGGKVWLWNLADPAHPARLGQPLTSPPGPINSVAFSPDRKTLAAASGDEIWLWNLADRARPARLGQPLTNPTGGVSSVAFNPDGKTLATGSDTVEEWNLNVDDAIQQICATTINTLTLAQWQQYFPQLPYNPPCAHPGHYGYLVP